MTCRALPQRGAGGGGRHCLRSNLGVCPSAHPRRAALESIRLDLLRLHTGVVSPDDLSADLERAREIGSTVDRELDAHRDVERLLSRTPA